MFKVLLIVSVFALFFSSCSAEKNESSHPLADYFYPIQEDAQVYVYRDVIGGLDEQFHRVYTVEDQAGKHIVVERYASDGRILEALNFNLDSLNVQDHMVVNRNQKKTKALLYKTTFFPWNANQGTWFASKFEGVLDSTLILQELKRSLRSLAVNREVMGNETACISFVDSTKFTLINPFMKTEKTLMEKSTSFFAKGTGLVEWIGSKNKVHFKLEQIMSQEEWLKIMGK